MAAPESPSPPPEPESRNETEPPTEDEEDDEMANTERLDRIESMMERMLGKMGATPEPPAPAKDVARPAPAAAGDFDEESVFARFRARLLKDPAVLKVLATRPELQVQVTTTTIEVDGNTLRGRLARLIQEGWFDEAKTGSAAFTELKRRGFGTAKPNVYKELDRLAELGFVTRESEGGYLAEKSMKVSIKKAS